MVCPDIILLETPAPNMVPWDKMVLLERLVPRMGLGIDVNTLDNPLPVSLTKFEIPEAVVENAFETELVISVIIPPPP